jgi:hypothetical protein
MSDKSINLEKAFAARKADAEAKEGAKKESVRERRKRMEKLIRDKARNAAAMDSSGMPPYCTLKTATVHAFFNQIGTLANDWRAEAKNMITINPHNPYIKQTALNLDRCATILANALSQHVQQVEKDNAEMHEKAKQMNEAKLEREEGERNASREINRE